MDIYPISNGYSTAYLVVEDDTAMLVDASTAQITPKVLTTLERLGARLGLIVLTHHHYDHVGAAEALRRATGARVAIHHRDAEALRRGGRLQVTPTRPSARVLAAFITRADRAPVEADLELTDEEDLREHAGLGRSFATPGHTPGSLSVALPDGTILAGDALTEGFPPLHAARGPMFVHDPAASRRSITTIATASRGRVLVAHRGTLDARSLTRLAARCRCHPEP